MHLHLSHFALFLHCKPAFHWMVFLAMVLLGSVGCKKKDQEPPSLEIRIPEANFSAIATQVLRLEGRATDNEGVVSVVAQLKSLQDGNVVSTAFANVEGSNWVMDLELGDRYTSSGSHLIEVTASDAVGLTASDFRTVNLSGLPLKYHGLWIAGEGSGNGYQIHYLDSLEQISFRGSYGIDLASMRADNESQSLLLATADGRVGSYNDDLTPRYEVQLDDLSPGQVNDFFPYRKIHYVGLNSPPFLSTYTPDGAFKGNSNSVTHGVISIARSEENLFLAGSTPGMGQNGWALSQYNLQGTSLRSRVSTSFPPTQLSYSSSTTYLFAIGNQNGNGILARFEVDPVLDEKENLLFPDSVLAVTSNGQSLFVLGTSGLYQLGLENWGSPSMLFPGNFESLLYDPENDRLFLGGLGQVDEISPQGSLLGSHFGNWGRTRYLSGHFNK